MTPVVAWRTWADTVPPPARVRLEVPGWGGEPNDYADAQPWHCKPFIDACSRGIELRWGLAATVVVRGDGQSARLEGAEATQLNRDRTISQFAPGHYGISSHHALRMPQGWAGLVLPHPAWSMDPYNSDLPAIIPGLIELDWWPELFFVVSRVPPEGILHRYVYGRAFCQVIPVPTDMPYTLEKMPAEERAAAVALESALKRHYHRIGTRSWVDRKGHPFGNMYKILSARFRRSGAVDWEGVLREVRELEAGELALAEHGAKPGAG